MGAGWKCRASGECVRGPRPIRDPRRRDRDLADYPDDAFDYAILSLTIQATRQPRTVLKHLLRISRHAIVSFPNFGHWQVRAQLVLTGRMPVTQNLPDAWYDSPNAHLCTIKDFADLCRSMDAHVDRAVAFNASGKSSGPGCRSRCTICSASAPCSCCRAREAVMADGEGAPAPQISFDDFMKVDIRIARSVRLLISRGRANPPSASRSISGPTSASRRAARRSPCTTSPRI